jgi:Heavy-metal resistance
MNLMHSVSLCLASIFLAGQPAAAQHHGGDSMHGHLPPASATTVSPSPYAGMEQRRVKALSDQQIADLKAGRGMSLALAAELNGYPGPLHVLELADALELSDDQRSRTSTLIEAMKTETIPIGEAIILEESALDRLLSEDRVTRSSLDAAVSRISLAQGALRAAHLRYHLAMAELLSPAQITRYVKLRGYSEGRNGPQ